MWNKILRTDEKRFFRLTWRKWHEKSTQPSQQGGEGSVLVWCAASGSGRFRSLVLQSGMVTSQSYTTLLEAHVLPLLRTRATATRIPPLMQDNATPHVAHSTRDWLRLNGVQVLSWPANSPDPRPH